MAEQLRPDIAAAAARLSTRMGVKKEIRALVDHVWPGERVDALVGGWQGNGRGLLALTDRRVLFLRDGWGGFGVEQHALLDVGSVLWEAGKLQGTLTLLVSSGKVTFASVSKPDGDVFADRTRAAVSAQLVPPGAAPDTFVEQPTAPAPQPVEGGFPAIVEQLRQLAGLRDAAVITIADFEAKKAELLARI